MYALSVRQPYAQAIFTLGKDVENRVWRTSHRGLLLIHASLTLYTEFWDSKEYRSCVRKDAQCVIPRDAELTRGAIIGAVTLHDIVEKSRSVWAHPNHFHWILRDAQLFERPIPVSGTLKLWEPDARIKARVRKSLKG